MSRILVVEDEAHLAEGLRFNLEAEEYSVDVVGDGEAALERLIERGEKFDAVVLDVMLPGIDGFAVVAALRKAKNYVPVLILTARGRPEDVLEGFAAGADDYLPKPFELPIFLARLQGLLAPQRVACRRRRRPSIRAQPAKARRKRRPRRMREFFLRWPDDRFRHARAARRRPYDPIDADGSETPAPLDSQRRDKPCRANRSWKMYGELREDTDTRAIDNFIVRLRRYLEKDPSKPRHLLTVRGVGYRFVA